MKTTNLDIIAGLLFYGGLPLGWILSPVMPGYWLLYFGLLAWYVIAKVRQYMRHEAKKRNFYHYEIEKEEDKAA